MEMSLVDNGGRRYTEPSQCLSTAADANLHQAQVSRRAGPAQAGLGNTFAFRPLVRRKKKIWL